MSGSTTSINSIPPPPLFRQLRVLLSQHVLYLAVLVLPIRVEYSLDGTTYQASNTFSGLTPNDYTLYVQSTSDNSVTMSSSVITINAVPLPLLFQQHQARYSLLVVHHQERLFRLKQEWSIV
jgi:hypothetical protein